ncbi:hypothetical protein, partial [Mesorhizobium sp. Root157]|uniref:hypothetical protein n=1 Tax=Mesorhizobium sp. Root157 TaxID=1736477 RepID=UPI001AECA903
LRCPRHSPRWGKVHMAQFSMEIMRLTGSVPRGNQQAKARIAEVPFTPTWKLAEKLKIDEDSLRQQVKRLRKEVADRLAVDQGIVLQINDFIENQQREGYRIAPMVREVSRADLQPA